MKLLLRSILLLLVLICPSAANFAIFQASTPPASFTPAWRTIQTSGGGAAVVMHTYSSGDVLATGDTFGPWLYSATGTCVRDGTTYTAPCWTALLTTDALPSIDATWANASAGNTTAVENVEAPSNSNVLYMWAFNKVYVSTNRGAAWTWTGLYVNYDPNGQDKNHDWMAVDPANPDIVYLVTPHGTYGISDGSSGTLLVNTTGRTCTSSCWTAVSGIPAPSTHNGGNVVFDPTSSVTGGVTQGIYANIQGSNGVWHSTNGGSTFSHANSGSPPTYIADLTIDKFGEVWGVEGFYGTGNRINKFASASWSQVTVSTSSALLSIQQDPNTGASSANNQMIVIDANGQVTATLNNGTDSWANTIGVGSLSLVANSPQAQWLNVLNQYSSGQLNLSMNAARYDTSGKLWVGTGVDMVTAPDPIVSGSLSATLVYSFNTLGADQLVNNQIVSPPGLGPFNVNWDRGVFANGNPDVPASSQYVNNSNNCTGCPIIVGGWSVDYAAGTTGTEIAGLAGQGGGSAFAVTTNGGNSWSQLGTVPSVGIGLGAQVAASTSTNWCVIPGDSSGSGQNSIVSCTANAGSSWVAGSFTGSPASFISPNSVGGQGIVRYPLTADRVTNGKFYVVDLNQKVFSSANSGANFSATGASLAGTGAVSQDRLIAVPGQAGNVFYVAESGYVQKSTNSAASFSSICTGITLDNVHAFGFGAVQPGKSYPAIYMFQAGGGTAAVGYYASFDGGTTCQSLDVPTSEQVWASHILDFPAWLSGDSNVYGRVYVGVLGSGPGYYIDTADACPWVAFSNVYPTEGLTGTVTLSAKHSGLVPVTSVSFYVDGTLIGTQTSGTGTPTTYSQSWVTGGVAHGAHTLQVVAVGNGCSASGNSFSIPITTSFLERDLIANGNAPIWLNQTA